MINHMCQPWSDCATSWMHNLENLSSALQNPTPSAKTPLNFDSQASDAPMDDTPLVGWEGTEQRSPGSVSYGYTTQHTDMYPGAAHMYGPGMTFMNRFNSDKHANQWTHNFYYPFSSQSDWELGSWLLRSHLSMESINQFLQHHLVSDSIQPCLLHKIYCHVKIKQLLLSFQSAKMSRGQAEMLPQGPQWKCKSCPTVHPTKTPIMLFYCDAIECIKALFSNPLFANSIQYSPFQVFKTAERLVCIYGEWMSGDVAWN